MSKGWLLEMTRVASTHDQVRYQVRAAGWGEPGSLKGPPPEVGYVDIDAEHHRFRFVPTSSWQGEVFPEALVTGRTADVDDNTLWHSLPPGPHFWWLFRVHRCAIAAARDGFPERLIQYA
jgi:hypothetical protein